MMGNYFLNLLPKSNTHNKAFKEIHLPVSIVSLYFAKPERKIMQNPSRLKTCKQPSSKRKNKRDLKPMVEKPIVQVIVNFQHPRKILRNHLYLHIFLFDILWDRVFSFGILRYLLKNEKVFCSEFFRDQEKNIKNFRKKYGLLH